MEKKPDLKADETLDALLNGRLLVVQKKAGYRVSLDAILLARFVGVRGRERVVDLGAGNGVVALLLARLHRGVRVVGLEIQEEMAARAQRSIRLNRLEKRVAVVRGDVRAVGALLSPESFDLAVCNPPYRRASSGRISPDPERRVARHEVQGDLGDFIRSGYFLLRRGGKMALIYPAPRTADLLEAMRQEAIEPKRLRLVHSFRESPASLILVEGVKEGRAELKIMAPLYVYSRVGRYTREMKAILEG